jgi:hypothetical protein
METKEKVIDNSILENEVKIESKRKKKSIVKFIHVFESDVNISPRKKRIVRSKSKHNLGRDQYRLGKSWKKSLSTIVAERRFSIRLNNL